MSRVHLVIPDSHAHPNYHNDRADWLSRLIIDLQPDVVVHIGDSADMPSLSAYDKGKKHFEGRRYIDDINAHLDFQERLWAPVKARKKKMPHRVFCIGNHEDRISRAISVSPELDGAISMRDLDLDYYYNEVVPYDGNGPGTIQIDGIHYAHFFPSGVMGRPIGGEHPAYSLIAKQFSSCTAGHLHTMDYAIRTTASGNKLHGLVCGCFIDYWSDWPGVSQDLWWSGVVIKHHVEDGQYDPEFVSMSRLRAEYE